MKKSLLLMVILFTGTCSPMLAQVYVFSGIHQSYVRNEVVVGESPIYSWHVGGGVNLYPTLDWKKTSINAEAAFIEKGYDQHLGNQQFEFRFRYITGQATISYEALPFLSLKGGVNLALLFDTNKEKGTSTYQLFDFGLVGGLGFLENKRFGFYTRVVYGLSPMLKYYNIDAMGNFNGHIHDLKNTCFMVGLRINIYDKKISLRN
ncbi:MAG: outer membrane beta-barrel protein [Chryseolinea sp.]